MQRITLNDIAELFIGKVKFLILGLVCGALLLSVYTIVFVEDKYTASISLYVQNTDDDSGIATTNNLYASRMLTNSYVLVLGDVETLEKAAENMSVSATVRDLAGALSIKTTEDTAIITVTATTGDALLSQSMCEAICTVAPEVLNDIVGAGSVKAFGDVPPAVKDGPHLVQNAILGALGGLLLVTAVIFIIFLADTTIKNKDDLENSTKLPILGEIPTLGL